MDVMLFWEQIRTFQDAAATRRAQIEMERPGKSRESVYVKQLEPTGLKHVQLQTPWKTTGWNWNPKSHKSHALQRIFPLPFVHNYRSISHFLFCWCAWINSSKFEKHCLTLEWRKQQIWYPVVNRCHTFPSRCFVSQANSRYLLLWCRKQREEQMWCSQRDHLKVYTNISWCKQVFIDILKFLKPDLREIRSTPVLKGPGNLPLRRQKNARGDDESNKGKSNETYEVPTGSGGIFGRQLGSRRLGIVLRQMFFGKWNDMKWDVIPWYWCNDKTWKSWLIQYSSSNLSGWKWTGKRLQEKKQRLLALAKQKREEVAATAKSRLRIWVCFWNPLFFVTLDRKDIIFSGSASRAFLFNLRRLIQWPLVPRKISGFRKSSSKVKATRRFWRFFLPSYGPVRLSWCRGSDFQDSDQLEDYMVSTRKQKALWIGTWAFYFVQLDAVVMSWKLLGHCWLGTSSQSGCQREGAPRVNSLWNHKVSSLSLFSSPFLAVRKAKRRFFKVDPNVCGFEFKCPISL